MTLIVHNCVRVTGQLADVGLPGVPRDIVYVNDFGDPAMSWWPAKVEDLVDRFTALFANWRKLRDRFVPAGFAGLVIADHEGISPWYPVQLLRDADGLAPFRRACAIADMDPRTRYHQLFDYYIRAMVENGCHGFDDFPHQHSRQGGEAYSHAYFDRPALWNRVRAIVLQNYWPPSWSPIDAELSHRTNLLIGRRCTAWNDARLVVTISAHFNGGPRLLLPLDSWKQTVDTVAEMPGAELNVWGDCDTQEKVEEHRRFMESGGLRALEAAGWKSPATGGLAAVTGGNG